MNSNVVDAAYDVGPDRTVKSNVVDAGYGVGTNRRIRQK